MTKIEALGAENPQCNHPLDVQQHGLGFLGALEHRSHHFEEASVLGLFQAALHAILHDRNELLVTQLVVIWKLDI